MAATYSPGSGDQKDRVRLLTADTDVTDPMLQDEEITDLLNLTGSTYLASAQALDIAATNETLVLKKIRILGGDITTDGPAVAKALRSQAERLRELASSDDGGFAVVELGLDQYTRSKMRFNNLLRGQGG